MTDLREIEQSLSGTLKAVEALEVELRDALAKIRLARFKEETKNDHVGK